MGTHASIRRPIQDFRTNPTQSPQKFRNNQPGTCRLEGDHNPSRDHPGCAGMKQGDIKIEVEENRVLRVSGERKPDAENDGDKWHRAERTSGKFWRQFRLPVNADVDKINAVLEDGVLRIKVAKVAQEKKQAKVVDIVGGDGSGEDVRATKVDG
ncbi:putative small heat shock protein HSP20 [Helianthus annuus]|nr:putative small heat shock protein HSP20 [Helianthus annuus]